MRYLIINIFAAFYIMCFSQNGFTKDVLEKTENIVLMQGEQKTIPKTNSIWVENSSAVKVTETDKAFILHGVKSGFSEIKSGGKTFQVNVLSLDQIRTEKALQNALHETLGLKLEVENGFVVIKGRLIRWSDWNFLARACSEIHCQYLMQAQISEDLMTESEQKINLVLKKHALPRLKIDFAETPQIHLPQKSATTKAVEKTLAPFGIQIEHDSTSIELAPLIKVQITVAEVRKEILRQYGIKWPNVYSAQIVPNSAAGIDPILAQLQLLEKTGNGKILASPNILCRSGKDADFFAGGEFPIKIINYKTQDVVWKQYGVVLKVSPVADYSGRMSISIQIEVSSLDGAKYADGIPGLFTNRVQSHFDLIRPKTIALSGLIKNETHDISDGLPWLSKIPILGPLFASKEFRNDKTELVIFVRPEIVNTDSLPDDDAQSKDLNFFTNKSEE